MKKHMFQDRIGPQLPKYYIRSMVSGLGFEGEDPKLLFARTFVFSFLLLGSPQICEIGLNLTSRIMTLLDM